MQMLASRTKLFGGENGRAEFWEGKNYGLTVTVSSKPWWDPYPTQQFGGACRLAPPPKNIG